MERAASWVSASVTSPRSAGFGDDRFDHVDLRFEDLLQASADGLGLVAHLQGEVPEKTSRDGAAALLTGALVGLGGLEQRAQPLERRGASLPRMRAQLRCWAAQCSSMTARAQGSPWT